MDNSNKVFNSLPFRTLFILLLLQPPILFLADYLSPSISYQIVKITQVQHIVDELNKAARVDKQVKLLPELANIYRLAQISLYSQEKKIASSNNSGIQSDERCVEIKANLQDNKIIKLYFYCPDISSELLRSGSIPAEIPLGTIIVITLLELCSLVFAYYILLAKPLKQLFEGLHLNIENKNDSKNKILFSISEIDTILEIIKQKIQLEKLAHNKEISATRKDLSTVFAKELEIKQLNRLLQDLANMNSTEAICSHIMRTLSEQSQGMIKAGFAMELKNNEIPRIFDKWGFSEMQARRLDELGQTDLSAFLSTDNSPKSISLDLIDKPKFEKLFQILQADTCLLLPLGHDGELRAQMLVMASTKEAKLKSNFETLCHKTMTEIAPLWQLVSKFEQEYRDNRRDLLTNLKNQRALAETIQEIDRLSTDKTNPQNNFIFIVFEGDQFLKIRNSNSPKATDNLIKELASSIEQAIKIKRSRLDKRITEALYRIGGCRFLLILDESRKETGLELADYVRNLIGLKSNWSENLKHWTISASVAEGDSKDFSAEKTLEESIVIMEYLRAKNLSDKIFQIQDLPSEYKLAQNLSLTDNNSEEIFSASELLKNCSKKEFSGILNVSSKNEYTERTFTSFWQNGSLVKAQIKNIEAEEAIFDLIACFSEGKITLNENVTESDELALSSEINFSLDELLKEATLRQELVKGAKSKIKSIDLILMPIMPDRKIDLTKLITEMPFKLSISEIQGFTETWRLCSGSFNLKEVLQKLEHRPDYITWIALNTFIEKNMIKLSRLRVSAYTN